jgi:hypothetical protein
MYSVMDCWRNTLLSNGSVNAFLGNGYVLNNRRIVGSGRSVQRLHSENEREKPVSLESALTLVVRRGHGGRGISKPLLSNDYCYQLEQ